MVTECPAGVQVVSGSVLLKGVWSVPVFSCKTFFHAFAKPEDYGLYCTSKTTMFSVAHMCIDVSVCFLKGLVCLPTADLC